MIDDEACVWESWETLFISTPDDDKFTHQGPMRRKAKSQAGRVEKFTQPYFN